MRQHYVTLNMHGNTVVIYMAQYSNLQVTFEQPVYKGFHTLVLNIDGNVEQNDGFNNAEVDYFKRFLENNKQVIKGLVQADA